VLSQELSAEISAVTHSLTSVQSSFAVISSAVDPKSLQVHRSTDVVSTSTFASIGNNRAGV
jgi:hypothetical protein